MMLIINLRYFFCYKHHLQKYKNMEVNSNQKEEHIAKLKEIYVIILQNLLHEQDQRLKIIKLAKAVVEWFVMEEEVSNSTYCKDFYFKKFLSCMEEKILNTAMELGPLYLKHNKVKRFSPDEKFYFRQIQYFFIQREKKTLSPL